MDLIGALEKSLSADKAHIQASQQFFDEAARTNLPGLLRALSEVLKNAANNPVARMQAGLQLKNSVYSKDPSVKFEYQQRWLQFPPDDRSYIKQNVLETLGTETMRPSSAAQCIGYIACAELPANQWPDLIEKLTGAVIAANSTDLMREAALEAIGYICQDIDPDILQTQSNEILTAIIHGMKVEDPGSTKVFDVRLAATTALLNSLEFTKNNFEKESERHFIMQVVCQNTQSEDSRVKVAALQCLVKIMSLYYEYMEHYMGPALFVITLEAMKSDDDNIALQGIEFWSTVCDEEVDLSIELSEATEQGRPPERTSKFYAKGALQYLVPVLLETLTKQEEVDDEDDWNPSKAAGVCLMLLSNCCENDIIQHIMPFIGKHFTSPNWRYREASIMAFGSMLEGPDTSKLAPVVTEGMPHLITALRDSSPVVADTAAWTIGRICEILPETVLPKQIVEPMVENLLIGLGNEPRVASNVCWAFSSLAEAAYDNAEAADGENTEPQTYCLSGQFQAIVEKLLMTADRPDHNQHNLRNAAYEALMEMIKNSAKDCYPIVQKTTLIILNRLESLLQMEKSIDCSQDKAQYNDLQSLLCATLQSVLRKVSGDDAPKISDQVMAALLSMLQNSGKSGVQEDALLAISTLIEVLGDKFMKYMEAFQPFLAHSLTLVEESTVCGAAVGIVGDLCRALGPAVSPVIGPIMAQLQQILTDARVDKNVKPQILSVYGDVALAIGPLFKEYLEFVMSTLMQASQTQVDKNDYDMVDYLNELREGCLEAYTGIVQGLKGDDSRPSPDVELIKHHVGHMVAFMEHIFQDPDHTDGNLGSSCGLIGDLCTVFGAEMMPLVDKEPITSLLTKIGILERNDLQEEPTSIHVSLHHHNYSNNNHTYLAVIVAWCHLQEQE